MWKRLAAWMWARAEAWFTEWLKPKWRAAAMARFGPREEMPREELIQRVWGQYDARDVGAFLDAVEGNFWVPAWLMRPEDPVRFLVDPDPATNWWKRIQNDLAVSEAELGFMEDLEARLPPEEFKRLHGGPLPLQTIGELAWIWCNRRAPPGWP